MLQRRPAAAEERVLQILVTINGGTLLFPRRDLWKNDKHKRTKLMLELCGADQSWCKFRFQKPVRGFIDRRIKVPPQQAELGLGLS